MRGRQTKEIAGLPIGMYIRNTADIPKLSEIVEERHDI